MFVFMYERGRNVPQGTITTQNLYSTVQKLQTCEKQRKDQPSGHKIPAHNDPKNPFRSVNT